jgi:hypothetical protein
LAIFLISRRCASVNFGALPPRYLGYSEANPSAFEVADHIADQVLAGERHLCDRGRVHALRRQQHHLRPPPGHHRPTAPADDPQQAPSLVIVDPAHPQTFRHRPGLEYQPP